MPWAEQSQFELVDNELDYLKKPVWRAMNSKTNAIAGVFYDGVFGMYIFKFITSGPCPKCLQGKWKNKEELIAKAKHYLSEEQTKSTPFSKIDLETGVTDEEQTAAQISMKHGNEYRVRRPGKGVRNVKTVK